VVLSKEALRLSVRIEGTPFLIPYTTDFDKISFFKKIGKLIRRILLVDESGVDYLLAYIIYICLNLIKCVKIVKYQKTVNS
jgi:hypothetical protein